MTMNRRKLLKSTLAFSCSIAASPLITPITLAAAPTDNRLVVIILRGGMDALDVVQPVGDKNFLQFRQRIKIGEAANVKDLDGFFALNQHLSPLMPLWQKGELAFAHACATPYRDKRSHFDGQDLLENGGFEASGALTKKRDGWLNRLVSLLPNSSLETAFSIGRQRLLILEGEQKTSNWAPNSSLDLSDEAKRLLEELYKKDKLFASASKVAFELSDKIDTQAGKKRMSQIEALAGFAADRLNEQTRIAAFSIGGFDTHRNQTANLARALKNLSSAILMLKQKLGNNWDRTAILAISEFGRTVRENGTAGTDHGTGGAMLMVGGAIRGKKIYGDWPGLGEGDLYQNRDLMPTSDIRLYAAMAIRDLFKINKLAIESTIFPNLEMGSGQNIIL